MAHDSLTAGGANELAAEADQAPGRHHKLQLGAAIVGIFHVLHLGLAGAEFFNAATHPFLRDIEHKGFIGLRWGAIDGAENHLGLGNLKLIALPTHRLNQNAKVQLTAAAY